MELKGYLFSGFSRPLSLIFSVAIMETIHQIYQGDSRDILPLIESKVDVVITSPPYNKQYAGVAKQFIEGQVNYADDMEEVEYRGMLNDVFGKCVDRLKDTGSFWINLKNRTIDKACVPPCWLLGLPFANRLKLRGIAVWDTVGCTESSTSRFNNDYEFWFHFVKDLDAYYFNLDPVRLPRYNDKRYNKLGSNPGCIWRYPAVKGNYPERKGNVHPAIFPEKLINRIVVSCSREGDMILDPFLGSGTCSAVANKTNRNSIGVEMKEEYIKTAIARIGAEQVTLNGDSSELELYKLIDNRIYRQ